MPVEGSVTRIPESNQCHGGGSCEVQHLPNSRIDSTREGVKPENKVERGEDVMRRRSVSLVSVIALAGLAGVVVPAAPAAAAVNEVTNWNRIATATLVQFPPLAGGAPPALQINMGMVQGGVYDAVNAIEQMHEPYLLHTTFPSTASKEAAVATAAFTVLSDIIASVPDTVPFPPGTVLFPNEAALQASISNSYTASLAAIPNGQSKSDGIAAGLAAAEAMIAARQDDGRFGPSQWDQSTGAGHWQPLLPNGTSPPDPTPWVGLVEPFLMESSSQFRSDGPNALTSNQYAKDFNEVKALGSVNSTARTPEQTHNAVFWQSMGGPTLLWNDVARDWSKTQASASTSMTAPSCSGC
jgi:hypothetical protein